MKLWKLVGALSLTCGALLAGPLAQATDLGWYGGASVGVSRASIDNGRISRELGAAGFGVGAVTSDDTHNAFKLFAGYRLRPNLAMEVGYVDLGRFTYAATTTAPAGTLTGTMRRQGANLDVVGTLPLANRLSAIGRAGMVYISVRDSIVGTGGVLVATPNSGKSDFSAKLGLGLQYDLTGSVGLRGEVERYQIEDSAGNASNINVYSAGIVMKF